MKECDGISQIKDCSQSKNEPDLELNVRGARTNRQHRIPSRIQSTMGGRATSGSSLYQTFSASPVGFLPRLIFVLCYSCIACIIFPIIRYYYNSIVPLRSPYDYPITQHSRLDYRSTIHQDQWVSVLLALG